MINETLYKVENIANEFGVAVNTADEISEGLDGDILVLSIQVCGDQDMPEVDEEMLSRLDKVVELLDTEEIGLTELISPKVASRLLGVLPDCDIRMMME